MKETLYELFMGLLLASAVAWAAWQFSGAMP